MSDYIYMLENHLSADQNRVVQEVQAAAGQANVNVFLTGGAMRDMLAGFRIRESFAHRSRSFRGHLLDMVENLLLCARAAQFCQRLACCNRQLGTCFRAQRSAFFCVVDRCLNSWRCLRCRIRFGRQSTFSLRPSHIRERLSNRRRLAIDSGMRFRRQRLPAADFIDR